MSTFMNTDPKAFSGVWVFCEQRQGKMMPTTFELISEGRKLADELGVELGGILLGDNVDGIAKELGGYGADKVYVYNSPLLKDFTTDAYTKVISDACLLYTSAVQIHGGYGFIKEYPVERKYRDCRVFTIYEGTSQVQQMVISGNLLK